MQRDPARQIVAVLDHLDEERVSRGHVEGVHRPQEEGQHDDMPDLDDPGQSERRHGRGLHHRE